MVAPHTAHETVTLASRERLKIAGARIELAYEAYETPF